MSQKKIIVTFVQSQKINKLLRADKGDTPIQELIDSIVAESEIPEWQAETFAKAWRWNHRNDNNNTSQDKQAPVEKEKEQYYVSSPLPRKTDANADPANGSGKVAQIIALAEQGKTTAEIIELGYNKSTVYRQYSEWKKRKGKAKELKQQATATA
jgi:hypothetical protein